MTFLRAAARYPGRHRIQILSCSPPKTTGAETQAETGEWRDSKNDPRGRIMRAAAAKPALTAFVFEITVDHGLGSNG